MTSNKTFCVYRHTCPNGKVYIGITSQNPLRRWNNGNGYQRNPHFWRAIVAYGWNNIRHEILFSDLSKREAEQLEIKLIAEHDSTNSKKGYNISTGGGCSTGARWNLTEEQKRHQSKAQKKLHAEGRGNVFRNQAGENNCFYGKKHTEEAKRKISEAQYNPVLQYSLNGEFVAEYANAYQASVQTGVSHILECCKGLRKTAGGYRWVFMRQQELELRKKIAEANNWFE